MFQIQVPKFQVPKFHVPKLHVPKFQSPKVPSSIVNPIIQSTSHPTAGTRFWCHLCPSKVPGDTAGPWEPTIDGLWRSTMGSTFLDNGFHLQNPNNCFRERDPMGRVCGFDLRLGRFVTDSLTIARSQYFYIRKTKTVPTEIASEVFEDAEVS